MEVQAATRIIEWGFELWRAGGVNGESKEMLRTYKGPRKVGMLPG